MGGDATESRAGHPLSRRTTACGPRASRGRSRPTRTSVSRAARASTRASSGTPATSTPSTTTRCDPDEKNTVYLLEGKQFDDQVALENGNFSFLMGADLDFESQEVRDEVTAWGKWYLDTTGVDGFRLDAVKHISAWFFPEWLDAMETPRGEGPLRGGRVLDPGHRGARTGTSTASAAGSRVFGVPLHYALPLREPGRAATTTCAGSSTARSCSSRARAGRHLRRQPRLPAAAGPRVRGRALVQAARLRAHPAAARRLPLRLLRRLLRRGVRGLRPGRQPPPRS